MIWVTQTLVSRAARPCRRRTSTPSPLRGDKGQTLEGGIRVPFFVSWPGKVPAGKVYEHPVITLDVLPTALELAGAASPANLDGVNLLPFLTGETKAAPHDSLYWRFGPQKAVRRGQWKLVDWRDHDAKQNSGWQLFDLSSDIGEQRDQAGKQPELVAQLSRDWEQWNAKNIAPLWHGSPAEDPTAPPRPMTKKK